MFLCIGTCHFRDFSFTMLIYCMGTVPDIQERLRNTI